MTARFYYSLGAALLLLVAGAVFIFLGKDKAPVQYATGVFDGGRAHADIVRQVDFGPRIRGEPGYDAFQLWIDEVYADAGWTVERHDVEANGIALTNIIAKREHAGINDDFVIIGAHYDTRLIADRDPLPENRLLPVPGANDAASGVALLVELARVLPQNDGITVWLVLFDAEDNGDVDGQPWIVGSTAFVSDLAALTGGRVPDAVVIADMIGDADLNIYMENRSDTSLSKAIWDQAAKLGYESQFIASLKYTMIDDHLPFVRADIPVALLIDFDYPYWHTIEDLPDKTSAESLKAVGDTLLSWIMNR